MKILLDAFWRAVAYCLHPRVIVLSLLPLVLLIAVALAFAQWGWMPAVDAVRQALEGTAVQTVIDRAVEWLHMPQLKAVVPVLTVIFAITPLLVLVSLLAIAFFMTPPLTRMVAERRFPLLEQRHGGSFFGSVGWSLGHTALALVALGLSIPLWFVPPLVLIVPPLIWGWLTYRVMAYDTLADFASREERRALMRSHHMELLVMGIIVGLLGAAPGVVWSSVAFFAVAFVLLVPVAVWIYALVFAFSSLWFAHYCLAVLQQMRLAADAEQAARTAAMDVIDVSARTMDEGEPPQGRGLVSRL